VTPVRVLTLIDSLEEPGGAEKLAVSVACALPQERFEVEVCATRTASPPLVDQLDAAGLEWFALGRRGKLDVLPLRELGAHLRRRRIEVIHSHMSGSNLWAALVGPRAGVPVLVAHEHGSPYDGSLGRVIRFLDHRVIGPRASAVVVGTEAERARLAKLGGIDPAKLVVIPAPLIESAPATGDLRAELGLAGDVPLVGTVAWLRPEKALGDLVDAFARLPESLAGAHLVIAGDGPCRAELESLAETRGVARRTHFLGPRDDAIAVLGALDVAAITSARESTSLVALESMAAGTPLVSTRVGGPSEFLEHGVSALFADPGDVAAISAAIAELLADPARARRLASAAGALLDEFSVARVAGRHAALYERLLAESSSAHSRE
jgi:glycosyltransferase involved in cell wall biosynthesis